jgi:hypothetical protein
VTCFTSCCILFWLLVVGIGVAVLAIYALYHPQRVTTATLNAGYVDQSCPALRRAGAQPRPLSDGHHLQPQHQDRRGAALHAAGPILPRRHDRDAVGVAADTRGASPATPPSSATCTWWSARSGCRRRMPRRGTTPPPGTESWRSSSPPSSTCSSTSDDGCRSGTGCTRTARSGSSRRRAARCRKSPEVITSSV